jgi:hypothetical protein
MLICTQRTAPQCRALSRIALDAVPLYMPFPAVLRYALWWRGGNEWLSYFSSGW